MIFPSLSVETTLQVNDKTRLDARATFITSDEAAITLVEIQPDTLEIFYDVTDSYYLDWAYATNGSKVVTVRVTTDGAPVVMAVGIELLTEVEDNLFSVDSDLISYESDVLGYLRDGKNSFKDKHRASQQEILNSLDSARIWKDDGTRYTADEIIDIQEFKYWSIFLTLKNLFESLSNQVDDIFDRKSAKYNAHSVSAKKRAAFRLDSNADGDIDESTEKVDNFSGKLIRG